LVVAPDFLAKRRSRTREITESPPILIVFNSLAEAMAESSVVRCDGPGLIGPFSYRSLIAASICGHTEEVAKEHYWKVGEGDLDQTMEKLSKIHSEKLAIKVAIKDDSQGLESSRSVSTTCDDETKKPKESLGFVAICRLLSEAGFMPRMGEEGLPTPAIPL
jgi:hypothetical protein